MTYDPDPDLDRPTPDCLSNLDLDRHLVGEMDEAETQATQSHLAACDPCSARRLELESGYESFEDEVFVSGMAARTRRAVEAPKRQTRGRISAGVATVVALAAAMLMTLSPPTPTTDDMHTTRIKGADKFTVYVQHPDGTQDTVLPGGQLSEGDAVRFTLTPSRPSHLTIVGVDSSSLPAKEGDAPKRAASAVSAYLPTSGAAVEAPAQREFLVEGSVVLDATLGAERFIAVLCDAPYDVSVAMTAARKALDSAGLNPAKMPPLALPSTCRQAAFRIVKTARN
jgi:hypothetical protein